MVVSEHASEAAGEIVKLTHKPGIQSRYDVAVLVQRAISKALKPYHDATRKIRDTKGDDRCWMDYEALFALLPEGFKPPKRDTEVMLVNCRAYIKTFVCPGTTYVSPQREIERLEAEIVRMKGLLKNPGGVV